MTVQQQQFLAFVRQVLERSQPKKVICEDCGQVLSGHEAEETTFQGETISNHECHIDEQAQAAARRAWITLTGDPMKARAKGYAVR